MDRRQKLLANTLFSILYQIITIVCGFILPRLFLVAYGSAVNGLITSITELLGFISLAECGVGAVVQSALYYPLARNDIDEISRIVVSAEHFFRKIAKILIAYILILILFYPNLIDRRFSFVYTATLIIAISISTFAQYYFGVTYRLLFTADQFGFIPLVIQASALILNLIICYILIGFNCDIHFVKLVSSIVFLLQPILLNIYGRKKYSINKKINLDKDPLPQKWNGLAQHISYVVLNNTDTFVLTVFSSLENVSVYAVYYLIVNGVKQIVAAFNSGTQALFGNILANKEAELLKKTFDKYEWLLHNLVSLVFSMTAVLIIPFVKIYTAGVEDANYIVPKFSILITLAQAMYCLRLPYNTIVLAAGHYKQTQWSAIFEAIINITISVILVTKFELVGVALGTLSAMLYRTIYLAFYVSKNIINRKIYFFYKRFFTDILCIVSSILVNNFLFEISLNDIRGYGTWSLATIKIGIVSILIIGIINILAYKDITLSVFSPKKER